VLGPDGRVPVVAGGVVSRGSSWPSASRSSRSDAARNGARILATARARFAERGSEVQLPEVAGIAGVGIGTVYRHSPTQADLIEAAAELRFPRSKPLPGPSVCNTRTPPTATAPSSVDPWPNRCQPEMPDRGWTETHANAAHRPLRESVAHQRSLIERMDLVVIRKQGQLSHAAIMPRPEHGCRRSPDSASTISIWTASRSCSTARA
jgi:Bacterial regulatory proteins, tetR family